MVGIHCITGNNRVETEQPRNFLMMHHFAYPNTKDREGTFIGCGRYVAFFPEKLPEGQGYEQAAPKVVKLTGTVYPTASRLAPESSASRKKIYERKDTPSEKYFGNSQNLAYLLALISRSRSLKWEGIPGDIWCTGGIALKNGREPRLEAVFARGFQIKLQAFLSDDNPDRLFLVPVPNAESIDEALYLSENVRVVSLVEFANLPSQETLKRKTIVKVLENELAFLVRLLFHEPEIQPDVARPVEPNPYRGLFAFQEEDANVFFGRESYIAQVIDAVHKNPFVAVVGPSGSGKSSLVYAGLIPRLRRQMIGERIWLIVSFRPGTDPFWTLSSALIHLLNPDMDDVDRLDQIKRLHSQFMSRTIRLTDVITMLYTQDPQARLLLFVDQFEELYTLCPSEWERRRFFDELLSILPISPSPHLPISSIVLTIRADFLGKALAYRPFADAFQHSDIVLGPMNREELREAIEKPVEKLNVGIEDGLTERILDAVNGEPGMLPLLEFALTKLWETQQYRMLTHAMYDEIGGVVQALALYAESVYNTLSSDEQNRVQRIFTQLLRPGDGTEDTRRVATRADVGEENWGLVTKLADVRLVVTSSPLFLKGGQGGFALTEKSPEETVEIVHEALITGWQRLQEWMEADREFRMWQERLRTALQQWEASKQDKGALLRGVLLVEAEFWLKTRGHHLSAEERHFITSSVLVRTHLRRRKKIGIVTGFLFTIIIAGVFGVLWKNALTQKQIAEKQTLLAQKEARIARSRELAIEAQSVSEEFPQRALLLAIEALNVTLKRSESTVPAAEEALRNILAKTGGIGLSGGPVAFSPDGRWLVNTSHKMVQLWDLTAVDKTAPRILLGGHNIGITGYVYIDVSPDSHWLVIHESHTAWLWDLTAANVAEPPIILRGHEKSISEAAFSPDSHWIATGSQDKTIRLWDLTATDIATSSIILRGHEEGIVKVVFSPDGCWLVTVDRNNKMARLWDLTMADITASSIVLHGHKERITKMAFSPDSHLLVTSSVDKTARLWDLMAVDIAGGSTVLQGHEEGITAVAFSPDGRWLVTGSMDKTARLWDLTTRGVETIPIVLRGHEELITGVAFSPDSRWLVTGSWDKTAQLWDLTTMDIAGNPEVLQGHEEGITAVAFSPDGRWLVTGSWDKTVRLWDLTVTDVTNSSIILRGADSGIGKVAFSPDSHWLATHSSLWDLTTANINMIEPLVLRGHEEEITQVAVSQDSHWLVTGSQDKTARLWDLTKTDITAGSIVLRGHEKEITQVGFSPDGRWLVTGSGDLTARLWDLTMANIARAPIILHGHKGKGIKVATFSSDSRWLVTWSRSFGDDTARLWDLTASNIAAAPIILPGNEEGIREVSLSPDSRWLITANSDKTVRLWDLKAKDIGAESVVLGRYESESIRITFSPNGHWLVTWNKYSDETVIRLWDLTASNIAATLIILQGHEEGITAVAFSPDSHWLATGSMDRTIRLWDLTASVVTIPSVTLIRYDAVLSKISFSPDGHWLVSWAAFNDPFEDLPDTIRLWDLMATGVTMEPIILHSHEVGITGVAFSSESHWLVTWGLHDPVARLWDLTTKNVTPTSVALRGHTGGITQAVFTPDNHWLITASQDKTVRLWTLQLNDLLDLACRTAGRNLSSVEWRQYFLGQVHQKSCPDLPLY
jgi:WD40 repeat protein